MKKTCDYPLCDREVRDEDVCEKHKVIMLLTAAEEAEMEAEVEKVKKVWDDAWQVWDDAWKAWDDARDAATETALAKALEAETTAREAVMNAYKRYAL